MQNISVLMLSRDKSVENPHSRTSQRLREYEKSGARIYAHYASPYNSLMLVYGALLRFLRIASDEPFPHKIITSQDPFECGLVAWMVARLYGAKFEVQMHGDFFNPEWAKEHWSRPWRLRIAHFTTRQADGVRVVSERLMVPVCRTILKKRFYQKAHFSETFRNFRCIFYGAKRQLAYIVRVPTTRTIERLPISKMAILYAGRFSKEKNLGMLIEAFRIVQGKYPEATLCLKTNKPLREAVNDLNDVVGAATYLPPGAHVCEQKEMRASIAVISSNHEGWSRFAIEAAQSNVPVVMTDVGCAGEIIEDGFSGWVVSKNKGYVSPEIHLVEDFARAIIEAFENPEESERRARNAKALAQELPDMEKTADLTVGNWKDLYGDV